MEKTNENMDIVIVHDCVQQEKGIKTIALLLPVCWVAALLLCLFGGSFLSHVHLGKNKKQPIGTYVRSVRLETLPLHLKQTTSRNLT